MPTEQDLRIARSDSYVVRYKLELLDAAFDVEDVLTSDAISATVNIDSSSDIRRTASIKMFVGNDTFVSENFEIGWINKSVRFSIGLLDRGAFVYYVLGTFLLSADDYSFDEATKELTLTLVDLMAYGTQARGCQIGTAVKIEYETTAKAAVEGVVARYMKAKRNNVDPFSDVIPYGLMFDAGKYPYDILKEIINLFPTREMYYDTDGVFQSHEIPTMVDDECFLEEDTLDGLIISERRSMSIGNIKNTTEIWGRVLNADYVATDCETADGVCTLSFLTDMKTIESNATYCFTPDVAFSPTTQIRIPLVNSTEADTLDVFDSYGDALDDGALSAGVTYVVKCIAEIDENNDVSKHFRLQGEKTIHTIVREMNAQPDAATISADRALNACDDITYVINPSSPYACDRGGMTISQGEIRQVLSGGVYASIYTSDLATERAKYENYLKARLNTEVELKTILIPFIDVNKKIKYTSPITGLVNQYLIKSVSMDLSSYTMTMKLARFYNYYPF